jgi:hypothetical protein
MLFNVFRPRIASVRRPSPSIAVTREYWFGHDVGESRRQNDTFSPFSLLLQIQTFPFYSDGHGIESTRSEEEYAGHSEVLST